MMFSQLLLLLDLVHMGMSNDQFLIMKYTQGNDCHDPIVTVPLASNSALSEFTICGKFSFRFLRESVLMGHSGPLH